MESAPTWFTGQLLLALPGIGDPRFEHSVIAMISHDEDGAMGIGIDDPIDGMTVGAVLDQLEIEHDEPLYLPVLLGDRKHVGQGKSVSVREDRGGGRSIKKKKET